MWGLFAGEASVLPRCDRGSPPRRDCGAEGRREREQEKRPCGHTFHRHVPGGCGADALQDPEPRENSGHERPRPGSAASSAGSLETVGRSSLRVGFPIRSQRFGAEQPLSPPPTPTPTVPDSPGVLCMSIFKYGSKVITNT